jgi:hypothetical protein
VGGLPGAVDFAIRIVVTAVTYTSTPAAAPGLDAFTSILPVQGFVSSTVMASRDGSISATLTSASPPNVLVGMGLGIPRQDGAGCHLNRAINTSTSAASPVSSEVEAGEYCVKVYDPGTLPSNVTFTLAAAHP